MRHHTDGAGRGIEGEHPTTCGLLDDVEHARVQRAAPFRRREAGGGVGEVNHSVRRDDHRVGVADRIVVTDPVGKKARASVGLDGQQTEHRVGRHHPAAGVEIEAENAPLGIGEDFLSGPVGLHAQNGAARHGRIELPIRPDRDVLRPELSSKVDHGETGEARILCVWPYVARGRWRGPRHRLDRHRPEEKACDRHEQNGAEDGGDTPDDARAHLIFLRSRCVSPKCRGEPCDDPRIVPGKVASSLPLLFERPAMRVVSGRGNPCAGRGRARVNRG